MYRLLFIVSICLFILACSQKDQEETNAADSQNLEDYILGNPGLSLVADSLIACAFGGTDKFEVRDDVPVSILFYPEGEVSDVNYFETSDANINPDDFSQYKYSMLEQQPVFNGYLSRFLRPALDKNIWCIVTYIKQEKLYVSNPIRIKYNDKPTDANNDLLSLDQSELLQPAFTWTDGAVAENAIYFHAIIEADNNLLSGTYTIDQRFQFYNLSNVVLNIRDITPPPSLQIGRDYRFILMGVSIDNWVNLIIDQPFSTTE